MQYLLQMAFSILCFSFLQAAISATTAAAAAAAASPVNLIEEPQSTQKYEGDTAVLTCRTPAIRNARVLWSRDNVIVLSRNDRRDNRYSFVGDSDAGVHDLEIKKVQLSDEGAYRCQISPAEGVWPIASRSAELQVLRNAESAVLLQLQDSKKEVLISDNIITVLAGAELQLLCRISRSNPAAHVTWQLGEAGAVSVPIFRQPAAKRLLADPVEASIWVKNLTKQGKLDTVHSMLDIKKNKLGAQHHNLGFRCVGQVEGYESQPVTAEAKLRVLQPPTVQLQLQPKRPGNEFHEHDTVIAECHAVGRPDNFSFSWKLKTSDAAGLSPDKLPQLKAELQQLQQQKSRRLSLTLQRWHHAAGLSCTARTFTEASASAQLRVRYAPRFRPEQSLMYAASVGGRATLTCFADANPAPTIHWRRSGTSRIIGHSAELVFDKIQRQDFGSYECSAASAEFNDVHRRVVLAENSRPRVSAASQQQARIGSSFRLRCDIRAVPLSELANAVQWSRQGRPVVMGDRVSSLREDFIGGTHAALYFKEIYSTDFGVYNCTANNQFGFDTALIHLTIQDNIPIAFIAGASIAMLMVLIFAAVLLCVCRRGYWESKAMSEAKAQNGFAPTGNSNSPSKSQHSDSDSSGQLQLRAAEPGDLQQSDSLESSLMPAFVSEGAAFFPATACAIHGSSLPRRRSPLQLLQQQQQQAYCPSIDLSDLTPQQQRSLSSALSPRHFQQQHLLQQHHQQQQQQQQLQVLQGCDEIDEAGHEDSVRSCDSGYGGAAAAAAAAATAAAATAAAAAAQQNFGSDQSMSSRRSSTNQHQNHHVSFHPTASVMQHWQLQQQQQNCPIHSQTLVKPSLHSALTVQHPAIHEDQQLQQQLHGSNDML